MTAPPRNVSRSVICPTCGTVRVTKAQPNVRLRCQNPQCRELFRAPPLDQAADSAAITPPAAPAPIEAVSDDGPVPSEPSGTGPRVRRVEQAKVRPAPPPPIGSTVPADDDPDLVPAADPDPVPAADPAPGTPSSPPRGRDRWRSRRRQVT